VGLEIKAIREIERTVVFAGGRNPVKFLERLIFPSHFGFACGLNISFILSIPPIISI
jgi:hypothetical protein